VIKRHDDHDDAAEDVDRFDAFGDRAHTGKESIVANVPDCAAAGHRFVA
jgi:hypothetical protein